MSRKWLLVNIFFQFFDIFFYNDFKNLRGKSLPKFHSKKVGNEKNKKGRALFVGPAFFAFLHRGVKLTDANLVCILHRIPERNRDLEDTVFVFG